MILGFFDLETTSVDVKEAHIIEWALIRYCLEEQMIISVDTSLVQLPVSMHLPDEVAKLTGISASALGRYGASRENEFRKMQLSLGNCDYLVAHNGLAFDKPVIENEMMRMGHMLPLRKWVDTMFDLPYPEGITTRKLSYLAAEHGFLNPLAHRALSDCIALWKLTMAYSWNAIRDSADTPVLHVRADVKYEHRELAKKAGYRWDGERKIWTKSMREAQLPRERAAVTFPVLVL